MLLHLIRLSWIMLIFNCFNFIPCLTSFITSFCCLTQALCFSSILISNPCPERFDKQSRPRTRNPFQSFLSPLGSNTNCTGQHLNAHTKSIRVKGHSNCWIVGVFFFLSDRKWALCYYEITHLLLQDWSKAGLHEQPAANTLQRRKEIRETESSPQSQGYAGVHPDDPQRPRMTPATIAAKVIRYSYTNRHRHLDSTVKL